MTSPLAAKGLKIVFWNAQSQIHKHHYICDLLSKREIDVLVILESWLRPDIDDNFIKVMHFTTCRQDRATLNNYHVTKRGGGICIYVKSSISFTEIDGAVFKINNSDLELISMKLNIENVRPIYLIALYRPPAGSLQSFSEHLNTLFDQITLIRKYDVILGGDFNIDYQRCSASRKILKDFEYRFGLTQMIQDKTRPLHSNTTVDLIYTNNPSFMKTGTLDLNISDHLPIYIIRKKTKVKPVTSEFTGRTYKKYSKEGLGLRMNSIDWTSLFDECNPNVQWKMFVANLIPILDDICPIRNCKYTNSRPEWITAELMELANDRDSAMKLAKREPTPENIMRARTLRNEAKIAFRRIREDFIKSKLEEHQNDPKRFWNELANVILGNKDQNSSTFNLLDDNSQALSKDVAANYVNNFFATIGQSLAGKIEDPTVNDLVSLDNILSEDFLNLPHLKVTSFSLDELVKEINNIEIYKSSGLHNISSRILKDVWSISPIVLLDMINKSLKTGIFPEDWKHGTVIPIPKVANPQTVNDLRPITLLPLPGKIMERLIHNKLYPYLEENNILISNQNGFRKQHGTTDTIFKFLSHVIDNMNDRKITIGSFHVKCGIYGFYNIKNEFTIIIKRKCLNKGIGSCEMMLKKLSC